MHTAVEASSLGDEAKRFARFEPFKTLAGALPTQYGGCGRCSVFTFENDYLVDQPARNNSGVYAIKDTEQGYLLDILSRRITRCSKQSA